MRGCNSPVIISFFCLPFHFSPLHFLGIVFQPFPLVLCIYGQFIAFPRRSLKVLACCICVIYQMIDVVFQWFVFNIMGSYPCLKELIADCFTGCQISNFEAQFQHRINKLIDSLLLCVAHVSAI